MSDWDEKLLKYGELFETKLMDLSVNIPLEDALDLGWGETRPTVVASAGGNAWP